LIVVALYPNGNKMNQMHLPFASTPGYTASHESYKRAMEHYHAVVAWCEHNLTGPWECDDKDILHEGIRVRIGDTRDVAYFNLKWN